MPDGRRVVLSYFAPDEGERLLAALRAGLLPAGVLVDVGSYGIAPLLAARLAELPGALYAPIFPVARSGYWNGRSLTPDEERKLPPSSRRWAGPLPAVADLLASAAATRTAWGTELGRRFRDALRHERQRGTKIPSWQLDEVVSQTVGSRPWRDIMRGVLDGLALGRPQLGDRPEKAVVWVANKALQLAGRPLDAELESFWRALDRAASRVAGEEYPDFVGDPRASARAHDEPRRRLTAGGPVRRALAAKYVAGLTPGLDLRPGLGGNVAGLPPAGVRRWRAAYVAQRAADGVAGFAEFDFRGPNGTDAVIADVLRELAAAVGDPL